MKVKNNTKRILAGVMAMSMILSCGILNFLHVSADEGNTDATKYKITLADTKEGIISFDGTDEKEKEVFAGEKITVVTQSNENYEDMGIQAENADTGEIIVLHYGKENDKYVFEMPEMNIKLSGLYSAQNAKNEIKWGKNSDLTKTDRVGVTENSIMPRSAVGSLCNISFGASHSYGGWFTREYNVKTETGSYTGYCVQPLKPSPSGTFKVSEIDNNLIKALLLIAPGGPFYSPYGEILYNGDNNAYAYAHAALSYAYEGTLTGLSASMQEGVKRMVEQYGQAIVDGSWAVEAHSALSRYQVYIAYNDQQNIVWLEEKPEGFVAAHKSSSSTSITDGNACYEIAGAEYGVYTDNNCTNKIASLTTNSAGETNSIKVEPGTYYVKEIAAPKGYSLDKQVYSVTVTSGQTVNMALKDTPMNDPMAITLKKIDSENLSGESQGNASLAGAEFTIRYYDGFYTKDNLPDKPLREWVFETKAIKLQSGEEIYGLQYLDSFKVSGDELFTISGIPTIPLGTITVEETKAPEGYTLENKTLESADGKYSVDNGVFLTQIKNNEDTGKLVAGNEYTKKESVIRGGVKVQKWDYDSGKKTPQAGLTFEGTELEITNKSKNPVMVEGKEYQPGEVVATLVLDKNGYAETAEDLLPYGEYELKETKAPVGYLNEGVISRTFSVKEDGVLVDLTTNEDGIRNMLIRGDFEITKINSETQKAMPGVRFKITNVASGESHIITTDENGFYSTESKYNKHSEDTNGEKATSGIWFGDEPVLDDRGALPYGVYTIEELKDKSNAEMVMYKSTFTISRNNYTIDFGNIENHPIEIKTTAKNSETNDHNASVKDKVTIIDTVSYKGVTPGKELIGKGVLMDKKTGEPLLDPNGNPITSEIKFTPDNENGRFEIEFTFNATGMKDKTLVVFEELYEGETLIGHHKDITDEGQTISFTEKPGNPTNDKNYQTGIQQYGPFFLLLALAMMEVVAFLLIKKRK